MRPFSARVHPDPPMAMQIAHPHPTRFQPHNSLSDATPLPTHALTRAHLRPRPRGPRHWPALALGTRRRLRFTSKAHLSLRSVAGSAFGIHPV